MSEVCMIGVSVERFYNIRTLIRQVSSFNFDKIYLCIPRTTRCGESFIGVSELELDERVEILRGEDYGGVTPIVYSSMISTDGTIYVINDSIKIKKDFKVLSSHLNGDNVAGFVGVCTGIAPFNFQITTGNVDWLLLDGVICFNSSSFDTRELARFRPELIECPDLRFSVWCQSKNVKRIAVGDAGEYITSTRRQFDLKTLKKAFGLRWHGHFKENYWNAFWKSLGFLTILILLILAAMFWSMSLKIIAGGILFIAMLYKLFVIKFLF